MLQLEALQAHDGDCLLLHYDPGAKPGLILIDGGSTGIYRSVLQKRLDQLRGKNPVLNLRLVVVSHIDADHITGILDMFRQMSEKVNDGQQPSWKVTSLWHNAFEKVVGRHAASASSATVAAAASGTVDLKRLEEKGLQDPKALAVVASVKQGRDLQGFAKKLTKINAETSGDLIMAPKSGRTDIRIDKTLTFTIVGPREAELENLEKEWNKSKARHPADEQAAAADYMNRTVPNLSSIVFLAEQKTGDGKSARMLLTGDAGGDLILDGLETAGLLDDNKQIKVDALKVQHHGSNHSVTEDFFRQVLADRYVISGNGKHGIPHTDTLTWLSRARTGEPYHVYMTNRQLKDGQEDLTKGLDDFLDEEAANQPLHQYHFRRDNELSIAIG
jgi:beta-lactamase superfamily II metal-dependent hydrolase